MILFSKNKLYQTFKNYASTNLVKYIYTYKSHLPIGVVSSYREGSLFSFLTWNRNSYRKERDTKGRSSLGIFSFARRDDLQYETHDRGSWGTGIERDRNRKGQNRKGRKINLVVIDLLRWIFVWKFPFLRKKASYNIFSNI